MKTYPFLILLFATSLNALSILEIQSNDIYLERDMANNDENSSEPLRVWKLDSSSYINFEVGFNDPLSKTFASSFQAGAYSDENGYFFNTDNNITYITADIYLPDFNYSNTVTTTNITSGKIISNNDDYNVLSDVIHPAFFSIGRTDPINDPNAPGLLHIGNTNIGHSISLMDYDGSQIISSIVNSNLPNYIRAPEYSYSINGSNFVTSISIDPDSTPLFYQTNPYGNIEYMGDYIIPEPSTYALILGAVALGFTCRRRK